MAEKNKPETERGPEVERKKPAPPGVAGQGSGEHEQYQRGGSGSEGGSADEESHGSEHGLTERGGGTGIRETEHWGNKPRDRKPDS